MRAFEAFGGSRKRLGPCGRMFAQSISLEIYSTLSSSLQSGGSELAGPRQLQVLLLKLVEIHYKSLDVVFFGAKMSIRILQAPVSPLTLGFSGRKWARVHCSEVSGTRALYLPGDVARRLRL